MQFLSRGGTRQKEKKKNPYAVISVGIGRNKKSGLWVKGIPFSAVIPLSLYQPITIPHLIKTPLQSFLLPLIGSGDMMLNSIRSPRQRSDILAGMGDQIVLKCIICGEITLQYVKMTQETRVCKALPAAVLLLSNLKL